jgi:glycogen(starch) synthase
LVDEKRGEDREIKADFLFEVSWEVCNKVGGINTVIKSKIPQTINKYGSDNYCLIGPYFHERVKGEFEELALPEEYHQVADELQEIGIVAHYGKWLTEGSPNTVLLDFQPFLAQKDDIKRRLWEHYKVDSLHAGFEFDEPVVWACAAGMIIERFCLMMPQKKMVAVFHEWLAGSGMLCVKKQGCKVGTVFVTHATVLGRCLTTAGIDIYAKDAEGNSILGKMDLEQEAYNRDVAPKHQIEKAAAHNADVFATVSKITGMEAELTLKKKPDIIVPNGLDLDDFPTIDESSIKHGIFKDKIYHFLLYYFLPYHNIDIENTLVYFIACRYEFENKGIDVFIKALAKLNSELKREKSKKHIVAFFWVPSGVRGIKPEIVENKMHFKDIEDALKDNSQHVMWHLLNTIVADMPITKDAIFEKSFISEIKKKVLRFKSESTVPPVCTHDLIDPNDPIVRCFAENSLTNAEEDNVKVIYYPIYLTGADNLLDLTYYEAILGSHLGVFPSFYEPWGYTPLETAALAVASITSDLAGFGRHIAGQADEEPFGIFLLNRMNRPGNEVVEELYKKLYYYTMLPKKKRIDNKLRARSLAKLADWDILINNYIDAHNIAMEKVFGAKD